MANNKEFKLDDYIHCGYATYDEYRDAAKRQGCYDCELVVEDAYKYLELIKDGYRYVVDDIRDILDINNNNTIQVNFMKDIDKMYINKPVKDLLYYVSGKVYRNQPPTEEELGIDMDYILKFHKDLCDTCKELRINPNFLIKRTFMKEDDIKAIIADLFKKEVVSIEVVDGEEVKTVTYETVTDEELNLIMKKGRFKSDKSLREELGFSNLNQIQRRIKQRKLKGYRGRFVMLTENSKRPMIRYLMSKNVIK